MSKETMCLNVHYMRSVQQTDYVEADYGETGGIYDFLVFSNVLNIGRVEKMSVVPLCVICLTLASLRRITVLGYVMSRY